MKTSAWSRQDGFVCRNLTMKVPLDYSNSDGVQICLSARELRSSISADKPYLIYLQGGPGFEVAGPGPLSAWQIEALKAFNIVLMDQRGTGLSTPFEFSFANGRPPERVAEYLTFFRADNIVRDAESLRGQLVGVDVRWTVLGQSFGGFCAFTYLSLAPEGLERVLITGGVPPIHQAPTEIYHRLTAVVNQKTKSMFDRFPDAIDLCRSLKKEVENGAYVLPSGDPLHLDRVRSLGIMLGAKHGADGLYRLLEMSSVRDGHGRLTHRFLQAVDRQSSLVTNPIYAILHESIYCESLASDWAAQSVKDELGPRESDGFPIAFDGEMIFPWMFNDIHSLKPLAKAAHILASKEDWGRLYDPERLAENRVPTAALVYDEDMYVDRGFSLDTLNSLAHCRFWSTNEYEHDGLRMDGGHIFNRLMALSETLAPVS